MKSARCLFALAIALVLVAGTAHADDRERARAAFKSGSRHYNLGEFQQALDAFREAYRAVDDPSFLFNIAQCERQLGHKREAVREYRAYLNNSADTSNREPVKQLIIQLEKEIAEEQQTTKMPPTTVVTPAPPVGPIPTTTSTPTTATEPAPAAAELTASAPPPPERTPAYKKWWVWTIVGGVAAAGLATGLAVGLTQKGAPTATTSLGTRSPF